MSFKHEQYDAYIFLPRTYILCEMIFRQM